MIVNDIVVKYLVDLSEMKENGEFKELEKFARENYYPIIQKESMEIIKFLIKHSKVKSILELGTCIGYSAMVMAKLDEEIKIDSIDRDQRVLKLAVENLKKFNLENRISLFEGEITEVLDKLKNENKTYDMVFIDAGKSHYNDYLNKSLLLLNKGGFIICDNILYRGEVAKEGIEDKKHDTIIRNLKNFILNVTKDEKLDSSLIPAGDGLLLIRRKDD